MKTAIETTAIREAAHPFRSMIDFSNSPRDMAAQGFVQATEDFCLENKPLDRYQLATHLSAAYAKGYQLGRQCATRTFASLQDHRGFPGNQSSFNATAVYGRSF